MDNTTQPQGGFAATGLSSGVLSAVAKAGFTTPTPIQEKAIPIAISGRDIIGIAQTGTGKTMGFALPIIEALLASREGRALVIVPTRELALQVEESIRKVTRFVEAPMRCVTLIGGMPIHKQIRDLRNRPRIIIATPGRLRDHMEQKTINLSDIKVLVLDEADRMLDMGFAPQIRYICNALSTDRQTMLFSATLAPDIAGLANTYLKNPERIEVAKAGTSNTQIEQLLYYVSKEGKTDLLRKLLEQHKGTVLVFSRTKHGANKLAIKVGQMGHSAAEIHSNRTLSQRRRALDGFKSGLYRVLVATDVASRGIDVPDISLVINFDLPDAAEDYVHRIGRTGRAGSTGLAISFASFDQVRDVRTIERLIGKELPLAPDSAAAPAFSQPAYSSGGRRNGPHTRGRSYGNFGRSGPSRRR